MARGKSTRRRPVEERFREKYEIDPGTGCWLWTGGRNRRDRGYGVFSPFHRRQQTYAHRYSYELHVGPIPEGYEVDHLCRTAHCVNPAHLEAVTPRENKRRAAPYRHKTHCKWGHPLSGDNLRIGPDGKRICKSCQRAARLRFKAKRREQLAEGFQAVVVPELHRSVTPPMPDLSRYEYLMKPERKAS